MCSSYIYKIIKYKKQMNFNFFLVGGINIQVGTIPKNCETEWYFYTSLEDTLRIK